jgi:amino acid adenylation domain-containing protein
LDEMFEISAHQNVGRSAINSWDGNFTYEELNDAVDSLAKLLIDIGVGAETKVPLLFQKSRWAVVAMLAVVKAGGAIVPLETMHPRARLESIMRAIDATVVLCSPDQQEWLSKSHSKVVVVDSSVDLLPKPIETISGRTTLSSALYIIFTSGSTGLPKGVVIEHRAFGSSVPHHAKQAFFGPSMRNLQLASYSFGAAVAEIFSTLLHGGCLCIVPNEARANLPGVVKEMNINFMFMSPTFARLIPPQAIPSVKTLVFGSEAMSTADIEKWCPHVQIVQGYGQTECSTIAATFPSMTPDIHPRNVGSALAARFWIVDPSNQHTLAPLGAVGELIIEGPIVARGYLNDPEKTAAAFIKPPAWRHQFEVDNDQRMYKTGDLARFHDDGTLIFMGRKDTQVKLRGQRVELGEIEYHIRRFIPSAKGVVVELVEIQTKKGKGHATLVAFVCLGPDIVQDNEFGAANQAVTEAFLPLLSNLAAQLSEVLPSYMIPSAYLPLGAVPSTTSGKVDRLRLREKASGLSVEQLAFYSLSNIVRREPATPLEKNLQELWAEVLDIDIEQISADSKFLQLGGDSINAIKLVAACRSQGLILSVAEIFKHPTLSQMAEILQLSPTT